MIAADEENGGFVSKTLSIHKTGLTLGQTANGKLSTNRLRGTLGWVGIRRHRASSKPTTSRESGFGLERFHSGSLCARTSRTDSPEEHAFVPGDDREISRISRRRL